MNMKKYIAFKSLKEACLYIKYTYFKQDKEKQFRKDVRKNISG